MVSTEGEAWADQSSSIGAYRKAASESGRSRFTVSSCTPEDCMTLYAGGSCLAPVSSYVNVAAYIQKPNTITHYFTNLLSFCSHSCPNNLRPHSLSCYIIICAHLGGRVCFIWLVGGLGQQAWGRPSRSVREKAKSACSLKGQSCVQRGYLHFIMEDTCIFSPPQS